MTIPSMLSNVIKVTPVSQLDSKFFIDSSHGHDEHQVDLDEIQLDLDVIELQLTIAPLVLAKTGANFLVLGSLKNQMAATVL